MNLKTSFSALNPTVFRAVLPAALLLFSACEKVIDLKLKDAEPRTVIEGNLSDQPGPYEVTITKTISFDQPNIFPGVSGALVVISDNTGTADTLTETSPGKYLTQNIQGVAGRTYQLKVVSGNQEFLATSTMPAFVPALQLTIEKSDFGGTELFPKIVFQDPPGVKNNYRALVFVNGLASKRLFYLEDKFQDGKLVDGTLFDPDVELKSGDEVRVVLQSIDANVLRYLREEDMLGNSQAASPANPTSNFSNGALGYFSAHIQTSETVIVP